MGSFPSGIGQHTDTRHLVTGIDVKYTPRQEIPTWQQIGNAFMSAGYWVYPDQSKLREELGVRGHSFEEFVREVVVEYMRRPVGETLLTDFPPE